MGLRETQAKWKLHQNIWFHYQEEKIPSYFYVQIYSTFSLFKARPSLLLRFNLVLLFLSLIPPLAFSSKLGFTLLKGYSHLPCTSVEWTKFHCKEGVAFKQLIPKEMHQGSFWKKKFHKYARTHSFCLIFLLPDFPLNIATLNSSIHLSVDLSHPSVLPLHPCNTSVY